MKWILSGKLFYFAPQELTDEEALKQRIRLEECDILREGDVCVSDTITYTWDGTDWIHSMTTPTLRKRHGIDRW